MVRVYTTTSSALLHHDVYQGSAYCETSGGAVRSVPQATEHSSVYRSVYLF